MAGLRTFDAFPKTEEQHVKTSSKGGLSSILTYLFLLFIAWSEFGSFFGGYIDQQYVVDNQIKETVTINLDLYVHMPCKYIQVNARDITGDRKLVSEHINMEGMPFFIPLDTKVNELNNIVSPDIDEILGEAIPAQFREPIDTSALTGQENLGACHVFGSIPVNKVKGELHITAQGWGYRSSKTTPKEEMNFAHVINELSFGDFYPYIDNPLDNTAKFSDEKIKSYYYFTAVVPTLYQKMGAVVDTNQYSLSEAEYGPQSKGSAVPGIFVRYQFEPMKIIISDMRIGFFQFIIRLVAILSFIVYTASWLFRFADKTLVLALGPKWSLRYSKDQTPSYGLLDEQ
ncbi:unnamed protein product [Kluyveromyces dobzhanskii CBS 2104]|uniref:Endoplasmic reticulum-Golgi intermediate compartment protein n=1 Tax=Kluyveromyces dobzhanskii CBS 2104 TaxID=1427455 RepID=A0A0A8L204_9SACH|nr:unnamed protein product [Kluyveromyces dobzhanskii CBS 2104]